MPVLPDDMPPHFAVHPQVLKLIGTKQYAQRTPEWYARRKTLMTASNAAGALGIPPYDSFRGDARAHCLQNLVYGTFKGNIATQHGVDNEDQVRDRMCDIMGERCLDFGLLVHPELDWLAASPDGITLTGRMIEIKCPFARRIDKGVVPHHYLPQVQVQMEVCGLSSCYFVQWQPAHLTHDGVEVFDIVLIERDRLWFDKHKDTLYAFYTDLIAMRAGYVKPPPPACLVVDALYAFSSPPACLVVDDLY